MRYQFYFCWWLVSPKDTSFRLRMLLLWCCQGIPGTPAFKRPRGLTLLACLCNAVIFFKYERLLYSGKCSKSQRGEEKYCNACAITCTFRTRRSLLECGFSCFLLFSSAVSFQLWVAASTNSSDDEFWGYMAGLKPSRALLESCQSWALHPFLWQNTTLLTKFFTIIPLTVVPWGSWSFHTCLFVSPVILPWRQVVAFKNTAWQINMKWPEFTACSLSVLQCDMREPNALRVAPAPLYNSFCDVHRFIEILGSAITSSKQTANNTMLSGSYWWLSCIF